MKKFFRTMYSIIFLVTFIFTTGSFNLVNAKAATSILIAETPKQSSTVSNDITISGYSLSKNNVSKINMYIDGKYVGQATYGIVRKDISKKYSAYPNSLRSGFSYSFNTRGFNDGVHSIRIESVDKRNNKTNITIRLNTKNQHTPIMGKSSASKEQMVKYFQQNNANKNISFINNFVSTLITEAEKEGVRADITLAQIMKETNYFKFTGTVKEKQNNFAGLGNAKGTSASFSDIKIGIRAVVQHLKAYATTQALKQSVVDERYKYVTKGSAPYAEWLGINENPSKRGWSPVKNYGYDIAAKVNQMKSIKVEAFKASIKEYNIPSETFLNKSIMLSAIGASPNKVLYKFYIEDSSNKKQVALQDYSAKNTFSWTPGKEGKYTAVIQVKDEFSSNNVDSSVTKIIVVKPNVINSKVIVLDAGHGGSDPGAVSGKYIEKELNMQVVEKLGAKLQALGFKVLYTRQPGKDVFISLPDRAKFANDNKADVFISIHHDSSVSSAAYGTSTHYSSYRPAVDSSGVYVSYNGKNYPFVKEVNGTIYYLDGSTTKTVSINNATVYDPTPSEAALDSKELAEELVKELANLGVANRGSKDHNLYVTRWTTMPSVLVEMGFISNPAEIAVIADPTYQDKAAQKMADVINEFFTNK